MAQCPIWPAWSARLALCALASFVSACGDDVPEASAPRCVSARATELQRLEGVYEVHYFTKNDGSCDGEGSSVVDPEQALFLLAKARGSELVIGGCADRATCRALAGEEEFVSFSQPDAYACSIGDGSLYGKQVSPGSTQEGGECRDGGVAEGFVSVESDSELRMETKVRSGSYPEPARGCSQAAAEQASRTLPCAYQVVRATRVEAL
jgi:hypothetical protein